MRHDASGMGRGWVLLWVLLATSVTVAQPGHGHGGRPGGGMRPGMGEPHQHFDGRFAHNQYYFNRGYAVRRPPPGRQFFGPHGGRYWYGGGNWYRWHGGSWVVEAAPLGLLVPFLPPTYTTIWSNGVPYYYANDTYYTWDGTQQGYQVVAPPATVDSPAATQPPGSNQIFVYPKNGQSTEQQKTDRYECHRWAVEQTGFDPTVAGGGVSASQLGEQRDHYFRAEVACLQGRGYTVE